MAINLVSIQNTESSKGFTLVELMVSLILGTIIISAIYFAFQAQQRVQLNQNEVAETQQNTRAVIETMTRDIQMAGYDPEQSGNFGISKADDTELVLTKDMTENGSVDSDAKETISFRFNPDKSRLYRDNDDGNGEQAIADNIEEIEFNYLDAAESETSNLSSIRSIEISVLARAGREDLKFTNTITYTSAGNTTWGPYDDHYRRRLVTAVVHCRNMGL